MNRRLVLFAALLFACNKTPPPAAETPIILISVDTLRADRVRSELTPNIVALSHDGTTFDRAYSHVPLTLPSHATILTGRLPASNGVRDNVGYVLGSDVPTLATILAGHGYANGAAVSSYVLRHSTGIAQGFAFFDDDTGLGELLDVTASRPGDRTMQKLEQWMDGIQSPKLFAFLHLYDPHAPYRAPAQFQKAGRSDYDAAVAYADDTVGRFIADLKKRGLYDRAIVVLLSDHGEGLGDHGELDHGIFVYREAIQVPLIVKLPHSENAGRHVSSLAALSDIVPTILAAAGLPPADRIDGIDLLHAKDDPQRQVDAASYYGRFHLHWHELTSVVTASHQFIEAPARELYDLAADPAEKSNVIDANRRIAAALAHDLATRTKPVGAPTNVDEEDQRKLASLGYIRGSTVPDNNPYPDPKERIRFITMYRTAERMARSGETVRAIPMLENVTHEAPEIFDAWVLLSKAKDATGHPDDAIAVLRDADRHFAGSPAVSLALADALLRRDKYDESRKVAEEAVNAEPVLARELLAKIALARGDLAGARKEIESALAFEPRRVATLISLARVEKRQGDWQSALATLDRALAASPNPLRGLQADRGEALLHLQRGPEAEQAYRQEVAKFPDDVEAWGNLAVILAAQGRRDEARATVQQAVRLNPGPAAQKMAAEAMDVIR
jgi:arylsulfatase A-like enzyme/tetratricopeptide (TPR) repeat protein